MDHGTREVRLQHWKNIITQCQHRPQGQTAKQWMDENGICEQIYYRWQRAIRQETFAEMTAAGKLPATSPQDTDVSLVEAFIILSDRILQAIISGTSWKCRKPFRYWLFSTSTYLIFENSGKSLPPILTYS